MQRLSQAQKRMLVALVIFIAGLSIGGVAGLVLPKVEQRSAIYLSLARARVKYALHPPQQQVFVPQGQNVATAVGATIQAMTAPAVALATPTPSLTPTPTPTVGPTATPTVTPSPTPSPTPLPAQVHLKGIRHEFQQWNNCGPATLSMALSYWGWKGFQTGPAEFLKPNPRDKNVSPYEMQDYVLQKTPYGFLWRMGGDEHLLKTLLANGFPVMVEKGFHGAGFEGWMGHYELVVGYDDAKGVFITYDSYRGPDYELTYDAFAYDWRAFNDLFLIPYDKSVEANLMAVLGPWADANWSYRHALEIAQQETQTLEGQALFFAWFNVGTSHVWLHEYVDAAYAYDQAFALYAQLPEKERPWRMLWYQTGPYFAYYYSGRYQDVINLATSTLDNMSEPILEESYYWRARAEEAVGQHQRALDDARKAVQLNPHFGPGWSLLRTLQGGG